MKPASVHIVGVLAAVVLLGIAGWAIWIFVQGFAVADPPVQASIIAGIVGFCSLGFTYWKERSRSIKEAHRDKKIEVYSLFYDFIFTLMKDTKSGKEIDLENDPTFQEKWFDMTRGVLFYGSPKVVSAFSEFRGEQNTDTSSDPVAIMKKIGRILLAMREDIGLSNGSLDELSIHQIYVTDDVKKLGELV